MNVSVVVARAVLARVEQSGADVERWLRPLSLDRSAFADVQQMLSPAQWDLLLLSAMRHLQDPTLGLTIGFEDSLSALHLFGWMLQSARSLRESLDLFVRYSPLLAEGIRAELVHCGETSRFTVEFIGKFSSESVRFTEDLALSTVWRPWAHMHRIARPKLRLRQPEPPHRRKMENLFRCELAFAGARSEAIFERRALDTPLPFGDAEVVESLSCMASAALQKRGLHAHSFSERVRAVLTAEYEQAVPNIRKVSHVLNVEPRKLTRRLLREGTSWRELVDDYQRDRAVHYLRRGGASIKEVSETLGYSEPSAFHRAFRRWTGVAPSAYLRSAI